MAKDDWGREPIDRYNAAMQNLHKKLVYVRENLEKLQSDADYLLDEMRSAETNLSVAAGALNERERGG